MADEPERKRLRSIDDVIKSLRYEGVDPATEDASKKFEEDAKLAFIWNHDAPFSEEERAILKQGN